MNEIKLLYIRAMLDSILQVTTAARKEVNSVPPNVSFWEVLVLNYNISYNLLCIK